MSKKFFKHYLIKNFGIYEVEFRRSGGLKICYIKHKPFYYKSIADLFMAVVNDLMINRVKTKMHKLKGEEL